MPSENSSPREFFRRALQRTPECPPIETLERVIDHPDADPRLAAHVQSCAYCGAEVEMLQTFCAADVPAEDSWAVENITERLGRRPVAVVPATAPRRWFQMPWLRPLALSSAAIMALVAIGLQFRGGGPPALGTTPSGGSEVLRGTTVTVTAPGGDLAKAPEDVRWEAAPTAIRYRVRLLEVDGHELWSAETAETAIPIPAEVRSLIVPSKTLLVDVTALDARGQKIADSGNIRFRFLQNFYSR